MIGMKYRGYERTKSYLCESEDVVNEEQHILALLVTEVLSNGQSSKSDTGTGAWGLVHLTVDKGDLGGLVLQADDTSLNHLVVQIVTLTGPLTHTSEHGVTTMSLSDVVNKLHNKYSLSDTGTTEKSNLTSSCIGGKKIDDLNTYKQKSCLIVASVICNRTKTRPLYQFNSLLWILFTYR